MTATLTDRIEAAMDDAASVWPHNHHLIEDGAVEAAVLNALNGRLTDDEDLSNLFHVATENVSVRVRLIPSDRRYTALDLIEAMSNPRGLAGPCGLCLTGHAANQLWVPAGGSVVEVGVCAPCKTRLDIGFAPVWR